MLRGRVIKINSQDRSKFQALSVNCLQNLLCNIVREIATIAGGSGGGRPDSAMAGTKDVSNVKAAMDAVVSILENMIK